jgi:hypothetical protein
MGPAGLATAPRAGSERLGWPKTLLQPLSECLPAEGLVGTVVVERAGPGLEGLLKLSEAAPVVQPDALLLHVADRALRDGVAGGAANGSEGVDDPPGSG